MDGLEIGEFCEKIGASRRDIDNWIVRKEQIGLRTGYTDTTRGKSRVYSHLNVLELAFLTAFAKAGFSPQSSVGMISEIIKEYLAASDRPQWLAFHAGEISRSVAHRDISGIPFDELMSERPDASPVFSIIRIGEIFDRVDSLFPGPAVKVVAGAGPLRLCRPMTSDDEGDRV